MTCVSSMTQHSTPIETLHCSICLVYMNKNVHSSTIHAGQKIIIIIIKTAYQEENGYGGGGYM